MVTIHSLLLEALQPHLGTYTLTNGTTPAICTVPPVLDNKRVVSGIECIIYQTPDFSRDVLMSYGYRVFNTYTVRLVSHSNTPLIAAIEALYEYFVQPIQVRLLPATGLAPEQAIILITSDPTYNKTKR